MSLRQLAATRFARFISFCLCYSLFISSGLLVARPVKAGTGVKQVASGRTGPAILTNKRNRREGELLVRFKRGASNQEIDSFLAGHPIHRGKHLRGGSRLEHLIV